MQGLLLVHSAIFNTPSISCPTRKAMKLLAISALSFTLIFSAACDTAGVQDDSFSIEITTPTAAKADANEQACHLRCDNSCPPNTLCIALCVEESYGNCGNVGRECNFLKLCAPGYVFDSRSCNCRPATPKDGGCTVDGRWYPAGKSFPAADGCNTCFCGENGLVGCTKIACVDTSTCDDPTREYVSTDPSFCATVKYGCESGSGFNDDCGCGCYL